MLYVNLMSVSGRMKVEQGSISLLREQITQRHGLFSATEGQILDMSLFEAVPDIDMRWKAWSKVDSAKR